MLKMIGHKIIRFESVNSTNKVLRELALEGAEPGTVVVSGIQTKGRGRIERTWESPEGGLWMSALIDATSEIEQAKFGLIPLMAGCAVASAISHITDLEARVKWPNDVLIRGRKVCGILGEMVTVDGKQLAIVGIGLNVNNPVQTGYEFSQVSTSIAEEFGKEANLEELKASILADLESAILHELESRNNILASGKFDDILNEWRTLSDTLGNRVRINTQTEVIEGLARDIDENGSLLVKTGDGRVEKVMAGDCEHISE